MTEELGNSLLELTADIVSSHVANNSVAASDLPSLISNVYSALDDIANPKAQQEPQQQPAVSVRASIKPDYLVCLEDGKKLKMLRRYLRTNYGMTPEEYRSKWGLPADYPMVAPNYAEQRRGLAQTIGLGRRKTDAEQVPAPETETPAPRKATGRGKAKTAAEK